MNGNATLTYSQDYWECLYNHKSICEALLYEGSDVAKILFMRQTNRLIELCQGKEADETEIAFVLLTSLNRSLYNHVLMQLNISLTVCCYECRVHTHSVISSSTLIKAGMRIIDRYADDLKKNESKYKHFKKACTYICDHLEEDLTIMQICEQLHVSRSSLCRHFKELTGNTFCEYLKQQRICRARILLSSTDMSMEDISAKCGFQSPAYFSTVFKSEMGMPPTAFRQKFCELE